MKVTRRRFVIGTAACVGASLLPLPNAVALKLAPVGRSPTIKVIGVGSAGTAWVNEAIIDSLPSEPCIVVDSDGLTLIEALTDHFVTLPRLPLEPDRRFLRGWNAALAKETEISKLVTGADVVIIAAGLGGNTASGAAPVIADIARKHGAFVVAVVSRPMDSEGTRVGVTARRAYCDLGLAADCVLVSDAQRLLSVAAAGSPIGLVHAMQDLLQADTIGSVIAMMGTENRDAIAAAMTGGLGHLGSGEAAGLSEAIERALHSPALPFDAVARGTRAVLLGRSLERPEARAMEQALGALGQELEVTWGWVRSADPGYRVDGALLG